MLPGGPCMLPGGACMLPGGACVQLLTIVHMLPGIYDVERLIFHRLPSVLAARSSLLSGPILKRSKFYRPVNKVDTSR
jgi:hypothetical protein